MWWSDSDQSLSIFNARQVISKDNLKKNQSPLWIAQSQGNAVQWSSSVKEERSLMNASSEQSLAWPLSIITIDKGKTLNSNHGSWNQRQSSQRPCSSLTRRISITFNREENSESRWSELEAMTFNSLGPKRHHQRHCHWTLRNHHHQSSSSRWRQWFPQWKLIPLSILSILNAFLRESKSILGNSRRSTSWLDGARTQWERCLWLSFARNHHLHQLEGHPIPPCDCWDFKLSLHLREGRF